MQFLRLSCYKRIIREKDAKVILITTEWNLGKNNQKKYFNCNRAEVVQLLIIQKVDIGIK